MKKIPWNHLQWAPSTKENQTKIPAHTSTLKRSTKFSRKYTTIGDGDTAYLQLKCNSLLERKEYITALRVFWVLVTLSFVWAVNSPRKREVGWWLISSWLSAIHQLLLCRLDISVCLTNVMLVKWGSVLTNDFYLYILTGIHVLFPVLYGTAVQHTFLIRSSIFLVYIPALLEAVEHPNISCWVSGEWGQLFRLPM